jgi:hypothetical protein
VTGAEIEVVEQDGAFRVTVDASSEHVVRVPDDYVARLGLADVDRTQLVRESFVFLLEREPKESIMRSFELSVIERYFPEYPDEIRSRLG